jgi:hypothetical protein
MDVVPPDWQDHAVVGLDGVVRISPLWLVPPPASERPAEETSDPGHVPRAVSHAGESADEAPTDLSHASVDELLHLARPFLRPELLVGAEECLVGIEAMAHLSGRLAAGRLHAAGELAARAGEELLAGTYQVADPAELSTTRREQWRARTKIVAAAEVAALTGLGRDKARQLVAVALSPAGVRAAVVQGLTAGLGSWEQVDRFWFSSRDVPHEAAVVIARALFATDVAPQEAAVERLDPEGELSVLPWQAGPFVTALRRLLTAARATDAAGEAERRARQRERRDAFAVVDDDGSGQVVITGDGAESAACGDRLHQLALRVKQKGDVRSLAQLRSDIGRALLLHGTLPMPDDQSGGRTCDDLGAHAGTGADTASDGPTGECWQDPFSAEEIATLAQLLAGAPAYHLQVLVPWETLTGKPVLNGTCRCDGGPSDRPPGRPPDAGPSEAGPSDAGAPEAGPPGVSRVLGRTPLFLTGGAARALALAPGTTMSRILFDPADGRCIERSVARYAPDAAMREQVLAADVTSRGYGSATLAREGQLDHVVAYLAGGATSETNLQGLDLPFHARKTAGEWSAAIDGLRNITWTSFFGRLYRTRIHDYRQYLSTGRPRVPEQSGSRGDGDPVALRAADRRHLASLLTYAALTARQVGAPLAARDDDPDGDDHYLGGRRHPAIWVRRTRERDGHKLDGPRPGTPTPEQIIATPAVELLRAAHWTDPFTAPPDHVAGVAADAPPDDPPPF